MHLLAQIPPSLLLAFLVASAYAALYNLWRNGSPRDLGLCLLTAWIGFALGQAAGWLLHFDWGMIGPLYIIEGTALTWASLLIGSWLRMPGGKRQGEKGT
jgi:hypothetical protein